MAHLPVTQSDPAEAVTLDVHALRLTGGQFMRICRDNPELRLELTAHGELIIMPPTCSGTGWRCSKITQRLANWAEQDGTGICFGPSTGFTLPNGARRSPDASWILLNRWEKLSRYQQDRKLSPICPDFVVELRSPTDRLPQLKRKMAEYIENGARLGWLLDPLEKCAYVYRPAAAEECLKSPDDISGGKVLPGFRFNFQEIV